MENKGKTSVSAKSTNDDIKEYFEDILPAYDKERVYVSDMKKVLNWYNILWEQKMLNFEEEKPAEEKQEVETPKKTTKAKAEKTDSENKEKNVKKTEKKTTKKKNE